MLVEDNVIRYSTLYDGIFAYEGETGLRPSRNNTFRDNYLRFNTEHDCHDNTSGTGTQGTANHWIGNDGQTDTPAGICGGTEPTVGQNGSTPDVASRALGSPAIQGR